MREIPVGTPVRSSWNPINDIVGLTLNGLVINNDGVIASPWTLSGNALSISNTDTALTNGITNTTVVYQTLPGINPPGNPPMTTVITLGQNAIVSGPIVLGSNTTITDDGPAPTSAAASQTSLLITSNINLNGKSLISGPSTATIATTTPDAGLTVIGGTIMNADVVTFAGAGTVTFSYLGQQASPAGFVYSATTTASQFAQYLATIPGLTTLPTGNVFGAVGGPFTVNLGSATPTGTALAVVGAGATVGYGGATGGIVEAGYGILDLAGSNSYDGTTAVTSGLLVDGAVNGLGSTLSGAKTVNNTLQFPIPGFISPGATLGVAALGDTATYNYDVLNFTGGTGTVTLTYNGLPNATTPGFAYTAGVTTPGALQAYLATLPGLTGAGAVAVTGALGGPYNVVFGSGVFGGAVLQKAAGPAVTITPSNAGISIAGSGL